MIVELSSQGFYLPAYLLQVLFDLLAEKVEPPLLGGPLVQMTRWLQAWLILHLFSRSSYPWDLIVKVPVKNSRSTEVEAKTFWGGLYPFFL